MPGYSLTRADGSESPTPMALFDPRCGTYSPAAWLPMRLDSDRGIVLPSGNVAILGGFRKHLPYWLDWSRATPIYHPATDRWTFLPPLPPRRDSAIVAVPAGAIVIGGSEECGRTCSSLVYGDVVMLAEQVAP